MQSSIRVGPHIIEQLIAGGIAAEDAEAIANNPELRGRQEIFGSQNFPIPPELCDTSKGPLKPISIRAMKFQKAVIEAVYARGGGAYTRESRQTQIVAATFSRPVDHIIRSSRRTPRVEYEYVGVPQRHSSQTPLSQLQPSTFFVFLEYEETLLIAIYAHVVSFSEFQAFHVHKVRWTSLSLPRSQQLTSVFQGTLRYLSNPNGTESEHLSSATNVPILMPYSFS